MRSLRGCRASSSCLRLASRASRFGRAKKGEILPPYRFEGQSKTLENSESCGCSGVRTWSGRGAQPERHRAVVHQTDVHVFAEAAARDLGIARARAPDEMIEERASRIGRERRRKARTHAFGGVRCKSELRNEIGRDTSELQSLRPSRMPS